jgi:hypothetical protein
MLNIVNECDQQIHLLNITRRDFGDLKWGMYSPNESR